MELIKKVISLLLIETLAVSPVTDSIVQGESKRKKEAGRVIVLSEKIGETIGLSERNYYGLFLDIKYFHSAVILQMPDSSFVLQVFAKAVADKVIKLPLKPLERNTLAMIRQRISRIENAKKQAEILVREKWNKERWRKESQSDPGIGYRGTGGVLGFTLGSAVGMLVGKGVQGKKVARKEITGSQGWEKTEFLYSYKYKYAPHAGAAAGAVSFAVAGYFLSRKADKKYYILVPGNFRNEKTKQYYLTNFLAAPLFGTLITGPLTGLISGYTLYTPESRVQNGIHNNPKGTDIGLGEFFGGYAVGAIAGWILISSYLNRHIRKQHWRESILDESTKSALEIQFVPFEPTSFNILSRRLPSGKYLYEYRMDILQAQF